MDIQAIYEEKKRGSAAEALSLIENGDEIMAGDCANEPVTLLSELHKVLDGDVSYFRIIMSLTSGSYTFMNEPEYRKQIRVDSQFFGRTNRIANEPTGTFTPANLSTLPHKRAAYCSPNVLLISLTPPDGDGIMRTSLSNIFDYYYLEHADKIIAEVNPNLPMVEGTMKVHISKLSALIEVDTPVPTLPNAPIGETEKKIGGYVSTLINDGDTVQFGIGGIPDALAESLADRKDLGIHTEMINSAMGKLMRDGVVTNERKTIHKGKTVAVFAWGDKKLYDMMDGSDRFLILNGDYVNDPRIIAQNDNMKSINTALNVDLTGQIASETIGYKQYSGTGGQFDTALGASWSKGGLSAIALKSTVKDDSVSTINMFLPQGSAVSLSRNIVDCIVTEYGIAWMTGRSISERAKNLIAVAHPKFREKLTFEAKKHLYI